jgi:hypothetical protein
MRLVEALDKRKHDQRCDNEPAVMKPDLDTRDLSEFDVGSHLPPA